MFMVLNYIITGGVVSRYYQTIAINVLIAIVLATSLNIVTGFLGQLVLGHAGFMAIGAYTAAIIGTMLYPYIANDILLFAVSSLAALVTSGLAGLLVGTPALRLRGDYLGIMTLGFGQIVVIVLQNLEITGKAFGLYGIPRILTFPMAFWTTVLVITIIVLFMKSRHGRAILSIREDEIASESVGINITKYKIIGFVMASAFAGIGGSMYAFIQGYMSPNAFTFVKSVDIFVIVVLGGMGSITGAIMAAGVLTYLPEELRAFSEYRMLIYSTLLIIVMLYRPKGLMGTHEFSWNWLINKVIKPTIRGCKASIKGIIFFVKHPIQGTKIVGKSMVKFFIFIVDTFILVINNIIKSSKENVKMGKKKISKLFKSSFKGGNE